MLSLMNHFLCPLLSIYIFLFIFVYFWKCFIVFFLSLQNICFSKYLGLLWSLVRLRTSEDIIVASCEFKGEVFFFSFRCFIHYKTDEPVKLFRQLQILSPAAVKNSFLFIVSCTCRAVWTLKLVKSMQVSCATILTFALNVTDVSEGCQLNMHLCGRLRYGCWKKTLTLTVHLLKAGIQKGFDTETQGWMCLTTGVCFLCCAGGRKRPRLRPKIRTI